MWYDDNGPSTEEKARAAAKASVDKTLQLSVANIGSRSVTGPSSTTAQYEYWVEISTKSSNSTKENDLVGTLYTGTSKSNAKDGDSFRLEVTLSNQSNNSGDKGQYEDATDYVTIEDGERAIVSFADDASDEFEVEFGDDLHEALRGLAEDVRARAANRGRPHHPLHVGGAGRLTHIINHTKGRKQYVYRKRRG